MKIYIDADYKCYTTAGEGLAMVETDVFVGKCSEYIEGYRYVPTGETWTREDGEEFAGEMIAPWKDWRELDAAQREYERERYVELKAQNADMAAALEVLGVEA